MIKDFIKIFKESYNTHYSKKIAAKKLIGFLNDVRENQIKTYILYKNLQKAMAECLTSIPNKDVFKAYIQVSTFLNNDDQYKSTENDETIVNLRANNHMRMGFVKRMEDMVTYLNCDLKNAKGFYKDANYDGCIEYIRKTIKWYNDTWRNIDTETDLSLIEDADKIVE